MKLKISAIGRLKSGPEQELFSRYIKRAQASGTILGFSSITHQEYPESKNSSVQIRKQQECKLLFPAASNQAALMVLDEKGKDFTSAGFARLLGNERDQGGNEMIIVLGGPDGLDQKLLNQAKYRVRFGAMTWPHQIARILLAEQLYRAMTILAGHPYHRQ